GHAAGDVGDKAAQRIGFLVIFILGENGAVAGFEIRQRQAGVHNGGTVRPLDDLRRDVEIEFVVQLADDGGDQVVDRDQPVDTAEFIDDKGDMHLGLAHLQQQVHHAHGGGNHQHVAHDVAD